MMTADYLLIAGDGKASRRQRRFPDLDQVNRAVDRWRKDGFSEWWVFAPRKRNGRKNVVRDEPARRLVRSWRDEPAGRR